MRSIFTFFAAVLLSTAAMAQTYNVTFRVDMNEVGDPYTTPEVNGSWDGWCGGCTQLEDPDGDGVWTITKTLDAGFYEYKFAFDSWAGSETLAPGSSCTITTGGFTNRFVDVTGDVALDTVCYGACTTCSEAVTYDITFYVNMNEVGDPYTTPEVNGNWDGWCGGCTPLEDPDGDGIWSITKSLSPGTYEYKFAYDSWTGSENLAPGTDCTITTGGFTNRIITVDADAALPVVCWGSCSNCGEAVLYDVTFQVNMNEVADPFTTPEVNGTFNGWCGGCAPMSDGDGDGIWEITIPLEAGTYEYKFAYDSWAGQETLTPGDPCTMTTDVFTNRVITISEETVIGAVCWGSCDNCVVATCELPSDVTIDYVGGTGTEATVTWTAVPGATQYGLRYRELGTPEWLKKATTGTGVFLIGLTPGATYQYQMVSRCGEDRAGPGSIATFTTPTRMGQFGSDDWMVYPNPSNGTFQLVSSGLSEQAMLMVMNVAGQQVYETMITNDSQTITLNGLADGLYTLVIVAGESMSATTISILQ